MSAHDANVAMLGELTQCAFRMGQALAAEAERAEGIARKVELVQVFDRCFFSVRMGIALQMRLRREAVMAERAAARDVEAEPAERDPAEREAADDHLPCERDREREVERATLPALVRALRGVAADAETLLPGPEPADLPRLRGLLAQLPDTPARRRPARTTPPAAGGLRARLTGSTTLPPLSSAGLRGPPRRGAGPPGR